MDSGTGVSSRVTGRRGFRKSEKKQMMTVIIVNSVAELGKISRGNTAFPWVLELPRGRQPPIYVCIFMFNCKSSQHAASSVELGH